MGLDRGTGTHDIRRAVSYQDFATLDGLSNGRAELMAGRGSFTESFPLFGYDLSDYDALFEENWRCCCTCARTGRSPGPADSGRRCARPPCTRAPTTGRCRSGSRRAAAPNRWCAPDCSACRLPSRSSMARPPASSRWSSCSTACSPRAGTSGGRWRCMRTAISPTPTRKPSSISTSRTRVP